MSLTDVIEGTRTAVDEPAALGGTDTAAKLGVPLEGVQVTVDGDNDLHGFFGFSETRPGFGTRRR